MGLTGDWSEDLLRDGWLADDSFAGLFWIFDMLVLESDAACEVEEEEEEAEDEEEEEAERDEEVEEDDEEEEEEQEEEDGALVSNMGVLGSTACCGGEERVDGEEEAEHAGRDATEYCVW